MLRGEIWQAVLDPPIGKRPVLLLSRDSAYEVRASVTVAPVTRTIRNIPSHVLLGEKDGMPVKCAVNLDDVVTIPKSRLIERMTVLSRVKMGEVAKAIIFALGL